MDYNKITHVVVSDIDVKDYPDFCDAYISSANYDGVPMTQDQLDEINEDKDFVYEMTIEQLF